MHSFQRKCLVIILFPLLRVGCIDPCSITRQLENIDARSYIYEAATSSGEEYLCDRYSIKNPAGEWFFVEGNQFIVTNATVAFKCGTQFGMWMNGTVPSERDGEVSRTVCVPGRRSACDTTIQIKVKRCKHGVAYKLKPTASCPAAYCFGYGEEGPAPSGKINKPTVHYTIVERTGFTKFQEVEYVCNFTPKLDNLFYQIYWYIDGKYRHTSPPTKKSNIHETNLKRDKRQLTNMGVTIACAVRARLKKRSIPGKMSNRSEALFAGIKVSTPTVVLTDEETVNATIEATVPFGCMFRGNIPDDCSLNIEMFIPYDIRDTCKAGVSMAKNPNMDNLKNCGTSILSSQWNQMHNITISWKSDGKYDPPKGDSADGTYLFSLRVLRDMNHPVWDNYTLPSIKVQLSQKKNEAVWKGKQCYAHNDPHMRTFDGWHYESQEDGVYTLYRHKDHSHMMEVQHKVTPCNGGHVRCNCGVAVRAGADVFVIDRCPDSSPPVFDYRSCRDGLLDVKKVNELNYKVYLPSGSYIDAQLWKSLYTGKKVMNIDIYPSVKDINQTEGLCGTLDGNNKNEFVAKTGQTYPRLQFTRSWKVKTTDNLFTMTDTDVRRLKGWPRDIQYCTCPYDLAMDDPKNKAICSPETAVTCTRERSSVSRQNCQSKIRQIRAARKSFSYVPDNFKPSRDNNIHRIVKRSNMVNMTDSEAKKFCEHFLNDSAAVRACSYVPGVSVSGSVDTCVMDIQLTGTTDWAEPTRSSVRSVCFKELGANNTLQEAENGKPSIADEIKAVACPNDCSGSGVCANGTCECNDGYGAADCSMDLNAPPEVSGINIDSGGLCDIVHCDKAYVTGDDFIESSNLTCKIHMIEIDTEGKKTAKGTNYFKADHNSIFDVHCPIPTKKQKRSTKLTLSFVTELQIAIANNGKSYSASHSLFILDAECQDTVNVSGQLGFALRDGFCFIGGSCVGSTRQSISDKCKICDTTISKFSWSPNLKEKACAHKSDSQNLWIIGAVLGSLAFVALIIVISLIACKKIKRKAVVSDSMACIHDNGAKPPPYR